MKKNKKGSIFKSLNFYEVMAFTLWIMIALFINVLLLGKIYGDNVKIKDVSIIVRLITFIINDLGIILVSLWRFKKLKNTDKLVSKLIWYVEIISVVCGFASWVIFSGNHVLTMIGQIIFLVFVVLQFVETKWNKMSKKFIKKEQ